MVINVCDNSSTVSDTRVITKGHIIGYTVFQDTELADMCMGKY